MRASKRAKFLTVLMVTLLSVSSFMTVFAATGSKTLEAFYSDIRIYVDGRAVTPVDSNGKSTEPFTVDGTTYLPVRAISEAFGARVEWDEATNSVYVGANPQNTAELYAAAVQDTMVITDDEIFPLVCCTRCGEEGESERCICDVIESVALVETSLSHILNAEGEKLQKAVELADSIDELLAINKSVTRTIINITQLEHNLYLKLDALNDLYRPTLNN